MLLFYRNNSFSSRALRGRWDENEWTASCVIVGRKEELDETSRWSSRLSQGRLRMSEWDLLKDGWMDGWMVVMGLSMPKTPFFFFPETDTRVAAPCPQTSTPTTATHWGWRRVYSCKTEKRDTCPSSGDVMGGWRFETWKWWWSWGSGWNWYWRIWEKEKRGMDFFERKVGIKLRSDGRPVNQMTWQCYPTPSLFFAFI